MLEKQNSASVNFMLTAAIWLVIGTCMGLILTLEFVFPDLFRGVPWLVFSCLCQVHTDTVMFAFLSGGMMGLWFYIIPRLTSRRLWSEKPGNLSMMLPWNAVVLVGIVGLLTAPSAFWPRLPRPSPRTRILGRNCWSRHRSWGPSAWGTGLSRRG
jgi:cbb3-type cytochrome oxidase subunit 1